MSVSVTFPYAGGYTVSSNDMVDYLSPVLVTGTSYPRWLANSAAWIIEADARQALMESIAAGTAGRLVATSATSLAIGTGTKVFTLSVTGKSFAIGQTVKAYQTGTPANYMLGTVTAWADPTLTIAVASGDTGGSGTIAAWTIVLSGATGPQGVQGPPGTNGTNGENGTNGINGVNGAGPVWYGTSTGSANAQVLAGPLAVLTGNPSVEWIAGYTNTSTTVNLTVGSAPQARLKDATGADPAVGAVVAGTKYVSTFDGTYWRLAGGVSSGGTGGSGPVSGVTALQTTGFTLSSAHAGKLVLCSGTFTIAITAAATLGPAFSCVIKNVGTGSITLDPNGSELVDGVLTKTIPPGGSVVLTCDGSAIYTVLQSIVTGTTTLDPANKGTGLVLSNNNLTFATSATTTTAVRTTAAIPSGKKVYIEVVIDSFGGPGGACDAIVGVVNGSASMNAYPGSDANGYGYYAGGTLYHSSGTTFGSAYTTGDIIGIVVDTSTGSGWFAKNNVWQGSGNPLTGANPAFSGFTGPLYFAFGDGSTTNYVAGTVRVAASSWTYPQSFASEMP